MDETLVKVLFSVFGLFAGVISWLFKVMWNDVQRLKERQAGSLESIRELIDERFDKFERTLDEKIDAGFTRNELNWVNDGRISPKRARKDG